MFKFYLDTDALIRLSKLNEKRLEEFKTRFNSINAELIVTHVQIDEQFSSQGTQSYQDIVKKALQTLKSKGIRIRVETTKMAVVGISRVGFCSLSTPDIEDIYHELDKEIDSCEKAKGHKKEPLNIKRDALIALSPLEYSFLITPDKCLCDSFNRIVEERKELVERIMTPRAKTYPLSPEGVANCILEVFSRSGNICTHKGADR